MSNLNHTPTPWKVTKNGGISGDGEVIICNDTKAVREELAQPVNNGFGRASANSAFIVRAVNSHEELLEALRVIANAGESGPLSTATWHEAKAIARLAIAHAESEVAC